MSRRKWTLRRHLAFLKAHFPMSKPVRVQVGKTARKIDGTISETDKAFYIVINARVSLMRQKETLWHEYAHAMAGWSDKHQHTDKWGICYAAIYRKIQEEI